MKVGGQSAARDVTITTVTTGLTFATALVSGIVLSRVLGPTGRGQLAQLAVWSSFSVGLLLFGVPGATTFSVARWPEHKSRLVANFGRRLVVQAFGAVLLFALLVAARGSTHDLPLVALVAYAAWVPTAMAVQWSSSYLQGRSDFLRFNWVRVVSESSPVIALVFLAAVGGLSVSTSALVYAGAVGSAGILGLIWMRRDARTMGRETGSERVDILEVLKRGRSFARRDYASALATKSNRSVDLLVLSLLPVAASDVGIYSVATTSSGAIALVGVSVGMVAFSRSAHGMHQHNVLKSLLLWGGLLTGAAATVLYAAAPTLIPLIYGSAFQDSVSLVRILVFGAAAVSVNNMLAGILRGSGRPGSVAIAEAAGAVATVVGIQLLGTSSIHYVAYSAVAGFGLTLLTEITVLVATRSLAGPDGPRGLPSMP